MASLTIRLGGLCALIAALATIAAFPELHLLFGLLHGWVSLGAVLASASWLGLFGLVMLAVPPVVRVQQPAD